MYGSIVIPPELIPVDWTVKITPVNDTELEKPKPEVTGCGSDKVDEKDQQVDSVAFNMVILDSKGRQRSLQKLLERNHGDGIEITLAFSLSKSQRDQFNSNDLKFIYLQEGDESWQLSTEDVTVSGNGFGNITTTINHLTSFALLLGGGLTDGGCSSSGDTLWVLSVCFLGGSFFMSIFIVFLFAKVPFLQRYVAGFRKQAKSIDEVEKRLQHFGERPARGSEP